MLPFPEVDRQTPMRGIKSFWIAEFAPPDPRPQTELYRLPDSPIPPAQAARLGAWLIRSSANQHWHGLEADLPTGEDAFRITAKAAERIVGIPRDKIDILDLIAVVQPGQEPGIRRTTFVSTFISHQLPKPTLPGIEMGLFPVDDLPATEMGPDGAWVPELLRGAVEAGISPNYVMSARFAHKLIGEKLL